MTKGNKQTILATSEEVWEYLIKSGGLDIKNYDYPILEEICIHLGIAPIPENFGKELQRRKISVEHFIGAFFRAIEPYARMMDDLCLFFVEHGAKRTNQQMKMYFDFGNGPKDLGFDIEHFKEWLVKWRKVTELLTYYGWTNNKLWEICSILEHTKRTVSNKDVTSWIEKYENTRTFEMPLPPPVYLRIKEIDVWIERLWQVWESVMSASRRFAPDSHVLYEQYDKSGAAHYDNKLANHEEPMVKDWNPRELYFLHSDYWGGAIAKGLFGWVEDLLKQPESDRLKHAQVTIERLEDLFSSLSKFRKEEQTLKKDLDELLSLPIWKRRSTLYQTWVLTQIDKALADYNRKVHHVDGNLLFKFSGTHLTTVETGEGIMHIWSELRSHLENPVGEGRKGNIQPDYTITGEPVTDPSRTVVVVECKQYLTANARNFAHALTDYARGRANARIILVNYGGAPLHILERVPEDLRRRTFLLGKMRPRQVNSIDQFTKLILEVVPQKKIATGTKSISFIAIDISNSMDSILERDDVKRLLDLLSSTYFTSQLLAVDTDVRARFQTTSKEVMQQLLGLPRTGGTDLQGTLSSYETEDGIVITDGNGWKQIQAMSKQPRVTIVINSDIAMHVSS